MKFLATGLFILLASFGFASGADALTEESLLNDLSQIESTALSSGEETRLFSFLQKGLGFYGSLRDYKAIFHKSEMSEGVLGEKEKIYLKFEKPWKIYMGWLNTHKKGLQLVYEKEKNDGKLVIHKPGLFLGLAPVIFLDRASPWVREGSASYDIEDAGLGNFLLHFARAVIRSAKEKKLKVISKGSVQEGDLSGERMEVTFLDSTDDEDYFAYRIMVLFDKENSLPLQMELYDWENKPIGFYSYNEFKADIGADAEFRGQIHRQLLKIYTHASD